MQWEDLILDQAHWEGPSPASQIVASLSTLFSPAMCKGPPPPCLHTMDHERHESCEKVRILTPELLNLILN